MAWRRARVALFSAMPPPLLGLALQRDRAWLALAGWPETRLGGKRPSDLGVSPASYRADSAQQRGSDRPLSGSLPRLWSGSLRRCGLWTSRAIMTISICRRSGRADLWRVGAAPDLASVGSAFRIPYSEPGRRGPGGNGKIEAAACGVVAGTLRRTRSDIVLMSVTMTDCGRFDGNVAEFSVHLNRLSGTCVSAPDGCRAITISKRGRSAR